MEKNAFLSQICSQKFTDIIPHFLFSFASHHTRRSYLNDLKNFSEFMRIKQKNIQLLSDIDYSCVALWKTYLENELKLDSASTRRKLNCLSSLFDFAQKRHLIDTNPVAWIKKPVQKNTSKTNELSPDEMQKIFSNIQNKIASLSVNHTDKLHYKRTLHSYDLQYVVLKLLYGTGLRVSELCHLKLNDLEIQTNNKNEQTFVLHIQKAKGGKEHKVYLNQKTADIILHYRQIYRLDAPNTDSFFVRVQQNTQRNILAPLTPKSIALMLVTNATEAGITKRVSPHSIRAGVATLLHAKGVPIARIQRQLGHSDIATTSVYIKKSNEIEESAALKLDLDNT